MYLQSLSVCWFIFLLAEKILLQPCSPSSDCSIVSLQSSLKEFSLFLSFITWLMWLLGFWCCGPLIFHIYLPSHVCVLPLSPIGLGAVTINLVTLNGTQFSSYTSLPLFSHGQSPMDFTHWTFVKFTPFHFHGHQIIPGCYHLPSRLRVILALHQSYSPFRCPL